MRPAHAIVFLSVLLAMPLAADRAAAQETHVVSEAELRSMADRHAERVEADRETVRAFLQRPEVTRAAGATGLDVRDAERAVSTLEAGELERIASRVRDLDEALVGGDNVLVISTTTLIIGLLILIIILVA